MYGYQSQPDSLLFSLLRLCNATVYSRNNALLFKQNLKLGINARRGPASSWLLVAFFGLVS